MAAKQINFRGRLSFPIAVEGSETFDKTKIAPLYENNDDGRGGWYPIGSNQMWHNGIHLTAGPGTEVGAIAPGRIVAARLGDDFSKAKFQFGSPRFVLIRHELTLLENPQEPDHNKWKPRDVTFYSLYMHLDCEATAIERVPWLQSFVPFLSGPNPGSATFWKVNTGEDGTGSRKGLNCRKEPTQKKNKWIPGDVVSVLPKGTIVELLEGKKGDYQEIRAPTARIESAWVYSSGNRLLEVPDFQAQVQALGAGGCAKLDYPMESGELVGYVGLMYPVRDAKQQFTEQFGVHVEIFSAENIIAPADQSSWTVVADDTNDDVICELGNLVSKVKEANFMRSLCWDTAQFATADDVESIYGSLSDAERLQLRKLITYNTSFWAIDWTKMVSTNKDWVSQFVFDQQDEDMAGKYMWWRECETKKVPLPPRSGGKAIVFHYHPLAAAEYLADHLPPPPLFFVKRSDKEYVVARPGDINIAAKEKVWVYEPPLPDWLLGTGETLLQGGQQYSGIGNFGETDLHEALIDPATAPGVPVLDASTKRIWASIWKSEGCLEALNTYDRAFLSFGPIQQTVGTPNDKGELQGALNYVNGKNEDLSKKYFGKYGLEVVEIEPELRIDKGHCKLDGTVLKTSAEKEVLRDFVWAYRCVKAMGDTAFRELFLEHGFKRVDIVKGISAKVGGTEVQLGDVYKTELALALLLDAHINLPALVDNANGLWVKAARSALGLNNTQAIDTSTITLENEYAMIKEIITLRNASAMWSPPLRASFIVLCVKDLDDALAKKFGYADVNGILDATGLARKKAEAYKFNFLEHTR